MRIKSNHWFILGCVAAAAVAFAKSGLGLILIQDNAAPPSFPVLRGVTTWTGKGGVHNIQLPAATVVGDLLVAMCETAGEAITLTDWVEVSCSPQSIGTTCPGDADCTRITVWTNEWNTGENKTTSDSGDHQICGMVGFEVGTFDTADHEDGCTGSTQAATTAVSIPGITTTVANVFVLQESVAALPDTIKAVEYSGEANVDLTDITELRDQCRNTANGGCVAVYEGKNATPDAVGATTSTAVTSSARANIMVGIKSAP